MLLTKSPSLVAMHLTETRWCETWATALHSDDPFRQFWGHECFPFQLAFRDCTIRQQVRVGLGAKRHRLRISNEFGQSVLPIARVTVARPAPSTGWVSLIGSPSVVPNTVVPVLFEGNTAIDIPPGATWVSDPIEFSTETGDDITISLYIAEGQQGVTVSGHEKAKATSWVARGDLTSNGCLPPESQPYPFERWYYLTGIEAEYEEDAGNIACFGDSITDQGDVEWDMNQYLGWPDVLSRRIQQTPNLSRLSVLNVGISGDQVWRGGLRRLERDVLSRNGVKFLFLFMGTNDLSSTPDTPDDQDELYHRLIGAYDQLVTRAHARGIAILASTITPFLTVQNQSAGRDRHREVTRLRLNKWIKDAGKFDYVVDWSSLLQDAEDPHIMAAKYRFNDFTHPNQAANRLMAEALDLHALSTRRGAVIESPSDQRVE